MAPDTFGYSLDSTSARHGDDAINGIHNTQSVVDSLEALKREIDLMKLAHNHDEHSCEQFHYFQFLPLELRIRVWEFALKSLQGYAIHLKYQEVEGLDHFTIKTPQPYPQIGLACSQVKRMLDDILKPLFLSRKESEGKNRGLIIPGLDSLVLPQNLETKDLYHLWKNLNRSAPEIFRRIGQIVAFVRETEGWEGSVDDWWLVTRMHEMFEYFPGLEKFELIHLTQNYQTAKKGVYEMERMADLEPNSVYKGALEIGWRLLWFSLSLPSNQKGEIPSTHFSKVQVVRISTTKGSVRSSKRVSIKAT